MMRRKYIVLGDTTSHGGKVTSARGAGRMTYNGKPVACVGDIVYCPKCKGTHRIIEGAVKPPKWLDGVLVAVEGCRTSCGAVLISVGQNIAGYEGEIGIDAVTVETLQAEARAREEAEAEASAAKAAATNGSSASMTETGEAAFDPPDARYAERFQFADEETGGIMPNAAYCIEVDGKRLIGKTDAEGFTRWVNLSEQSQVAVHWGREAERRARQQG